MTRLVAHRGQNRDYPENTLPALEQAIACGASAVEFDLQMTADQVPVVCHDITLVRTGGVDANIAKTPSETLRRYSVGEPARLGERFADLPLPTLREVVGLLRRHPQVTAFVELKGESIDAFGVDAFVGRVCEELIPIAAQCVVIADSLEALLAVRGCCPIPIGWIIHRWSAGDRTQALQHRLDYLVVNHNRCPQGYDLGADPWQWVLYETGDPSLARALFERGAAWVESNDVCALLRALEGGE